MSVSISGQEPLSPVLPDLPERIRDKKQKYQAYADRALAALDVYLEQVAAQDRGDTEE